VRYFGLSVATLLCTDALDRMARDDPSGFVRVVANILPDKLEVDVKHQSRSSVWTRRRRNMTATC
jgi:hypothetical protein